ncbi:hypothetical protein [Kamptonema sp. UHCC 0994]|uniref:hypothetical protein n=1 Tax=Kamptonema sp. UHCC 0994 TaxID=3031329 RepID=UPI0023BA382F|nr:hypothetical protein [Kamptonema sp. UHCC 0994]MDF0551522.1 hypothetical protein [Kamptonema sp. UHCC 0994]
MKGNIFSQFLLLAAIAIASNSLLALAAKHTSNNVSSETQEFLLSSCVPNNSDPDGPTCGAH